MQVLRVHKGSLSLSPALGKIGALASDVLGILTRGSVSVPQVNPFYRYDAFPKHMTTKTYKGAREL
jgi:hypothetical protein